MSFNFDLYEKAAYTCGCCKQQKVGYKMKTKVDDPSIDYHRFYSWCVAKFGGQFLERPSKDRPFVDAKVARETYDDDSFFLLLLQKYNIEFINKYCRQDNNTDDIKPEHDDFKIDSGDDDKGTNQDDTIPHEDRKTNVAAGVAAGDNDDSDDSETIVIEWVPKKAAEFLKKQEDVVKREGGGGDDSDTMTDDDNKTILDGVPDY